MMSEVTLSEHDTATIQVAGILVFIGILVFDGIALKTISEATGAGLFGICGTYGSSSSIAVLSIVLITGPVAAVLGKNFTQRALAKHFKARQAARKDGAHEGRG